jgi:rRNA small subunit pseudouridine methyltransferase Nep1
VPSLHPHIIILEDASLELVAKKFWNHPACVFVESRFSIPPENQILDDNYHHDIVRLLPTSEKRGRPDVVHFALLDIMSTPAYQNGIIRPIIHTINKDVIVIKDRVRAPRTELRFSGVMSKILRNQMGPAETALFEHQEDQTTKQLVSSLRPRKVFCLSSQGIPKDLGEIVAKESENEETSAWLVGGFAKGHMSEEAKSTSDEVISISPQELAAHVVTARLSYEIERASLHRKKSEG